MNNGVHDADKLVIKACDLAIAGTLHVLLVRIVRLTC